jgi:hypothetical protein
METQRLASEAREASAQLAVISPLAARRDEENARLRQVLAEQAASLARASGDALAPTASPPQRKQAAAV